MAPTGPLAGMPICQVPALALQRVDAPAVSKLSDQRTVSAVANGENAAEATANTAAEHRPSRFRAEERKSGRAEERKSGRFMAVGVGDERGYGSWSLSWPAGRRNWKDGAREDFEAVGANECFWARTMTP